MNRFIGLTVSAAALMFWACGDHSSRVVDVGEPSIPVVKKGEKFPKCDDSNKGVLYYAEDSLAVYYCNKKSWIPVKGADGQKGEPGDEGTSCTVEKKKNGDFDVFCGDSLMGTLTNSVTEVKCVADSIKNGYKIVCGGDSVGVVLNGGQGGKGETGPKGDNGTSCSVRPVTDGFEVLCDEKVVGILKNGLKGADGVDGDNGDDCTMTDNLDGTIFQICGQDTVTIYKALCGTEPYDPTGDNFCYGVTLVKKCAGKAYDINTQKCEADEIQEL